MTRVYRPVRPGERYGKLVTVKRKRWSGRARWVCRCDCGGEAVALVSALRAGDTRSCGCVKNGRRVIDITGQRFGKLVVVRRHSKPGEASHVRWLCRCDCGAEHVAIGRNLVRADSPLSSCGTCGPRGPRILKQRETLSRKRSEAAAAERTGEPVETAVGWDAIAAMTGRTVGWCRAMVDSILPLPVRKPAAAEPWMIRSEYDEWRRDMTRSGGEQCGACGGRGHRSSSQQCPQRGAVTA